MFKSKSATVIIAFAAASIAVFLLFGIFTAKTDLESGILHEDSITFLPDGGEPIPVSSDDEVRFDGVYTSIITVDSEDSYIEISLNFGAGEAELFVDGKRVYGGFADSTDQTAGAPAVKLALYLEEEPTSLEARIRYTDPKNYIFPALVIVDGSESKDMISAAAVNSSALYAGMSGVGCIIIIVLFFISLSFSKPDYSLIPLGLGILCWCVRMLLCTGACKIPAWFEWVSYYLLPILPAALIIVYIFMNREKKLLKFLLILSAILAAAVVSAGVLSLALERAPEFLFKLGMLTRLISSKSFDPAVSLLTQYLILLAVTAAIIYHVTNIISAQSERTALESRTAAMVLGYENLLENVKKTAATRREWKNDLLALSLLYRRGKTDELGKYLEDKNRLLAEAEWVPLTENLVFDVILNSASSRAHSAGIAFDAELNIPKELNVKEGDLCSLLMNMLDNAINACKKIADGDRFISFSAVKKGDFLAIRCSNSAPSEQPKKPDEKSDISHGWGIKNMREIAEKYGSDIVINRSDGVFTVKTLLSLSEND